MPDLAEHRESFLQEVQCAMEAFHDAGVAHLDLYLSNIMWRPVSDKAVDVKVIDWDAAHFLYEQPHEKVLDNLYPRREKLCQLAMNADNVQQPTNAEIMRYYDISLVRTMIANKENLLLRVRDKACLDDEFLKIQLLQISEAKK